MYFVLHEMNQYLRRLITEDSFILHFVIVWLLIFRLNWRITAEKSAGFKKSLMKF